jgi:soluble cytochrome b562
MTRPDHPEDRNEPLSEDRLAPGKPDEDLRTWPDPPQERIYNPNSQAWEAPSPEQPTVTTPWEVKDFSWEEDPVVYPQATNPSVTESEDSSRAVGQSVPDNLELSEDHEWTLANWTQQVAFSEDGLDEIAIDNGPSYSVSEPSTAANSATANSNDPWDDEHAHLFASPELDLEFEHREQDVEPVSPAPLVDRAHRSGPDPSPMEKAAAESTPGKTVHVPGNRPGKASSPRWRIPRLQVPLKVRETLTRVKVPPKVIGAMSAVGASPVVVQLRRFGGWPWVFAIGVSGATSMSAFSWLAGLPPVPNCNLLVKAWSDSERLYCADQAARKKDPKALTSALAMVGEWNEKDPVYSQARKLADDWSRSILVVADQKLDEGNLDEAVKLAKQVPTYSKVYDESQELIKQWQTNWEEGDRLLEEARTSIAKQDWGMATDQMRQLVQLGGDHWQKRADKLISEMTIEQDAFRQLNLAADKANYGSVDDIVNAIQMASKIDPQRAARKKVPESIDQWSAKLVELSDSYYKSGDYDQAAKAAQNVPPGTKAEADAIALGQLSQAKLVSQQDSPLAYAEAWALASQVPSQSKVAPEVVPEQEKWEAQVQSWSQVEFAKWFTRLDQVFGYQLAIDHATLVDSDSPRRVEAQTLVAQWTRQVDSVMDRQYLARARQLASTGKPEDLTAAISQAGQIKPESPLRAQAQGLIAEWASSAQKREDQPILDKALALAKTGDLDGAINTAEQIGSNRYLYDDAQQAIAGWVGEIQTKEDRPILNEAESLARNGQLSSAINRASDISPGRALYGEAQDRIAAWSSELNPSSPPSPVAEEEPPPESRQEEAYYVEPEPEPEPYFEPEPPPLPEEPAPEEFIEEEFVDSTVGETDTGVPPESIQEEF